MSVRIRPATPADAPALTDIAFASKASWGYDAEFMQACRDNLRLTPDAVESGPTFVAEDDRGIAGFYRLDVAAADLDAMFVEPSRLRTGVGRALWEHCLRTAAEHGLDQFTIASDPYAEPFYLAMGAKPSGSIESNVVPGRFLPLLRAPTGQDFGGARWR